VPAEEGEIVVLRTADATSAFLVDAARDHCEITARPPAGADSTRPFVAGCAHVDGAEVDLLDVDDLVGWSLGDGAREGTAP
jgi:hypothetical protein